MSPASTSTIRPLNVVTVSSPRCLRSSPGIFRNAETGTRRSTGASMAASTCARSEVWRCSSRGGLAVTTCFVTPESIANPAPSAVLPSSGFAPAARPPVRIWCPASDFGGRAITSQSVTGRVWQASRKRSCTSSWPSWRVSCMVAGETSPERTLHRQLRHRPRAPQVASMATPAARAASSSEAPRPTRARRTGFASPGSTKPTSIPLPCASFIALPSSCPGTTRSSGASRSEMSGYAFGQPDLRPCRHPSPASLLDSAKCRAAPPTNPTCGPAVTHRRRRRWAQERK